MLSGLAYTSWNLASPPSASSSSGLTVEPPAARLCKAELPILGVGSSTGKGAWRPHTGSAALMGFSRVGSRGEAHAGPQKPQVSRRQEAPSILYWSPSLDVSLLIPSPLPPPISSTLFPATPPPHHLRVTPSYSEIPLPLGTQTPQPPLVTHFSQLQRRFCRQGQGRLRTGGADYGVLSFGCSADRVRLINYPQGFQHDVRGLTDMRNQVGCGLRERVSAQGGHSWG